MKRTEKEEAIKDLKERFQKAQITLLADFCGLSVAQVTHLRRSLRAAKADMKVVKNTLALRAIQDTELKPLENHFAGPTAVITATEDPVTPAKALTQFMKSAEKLKLKGGFLAGKVLNLSEIEALSKLPSREAMIASLMGSMNAPAQNLVNVLSAVARKFVYALAAIRDKKV